MAVEDIGESWEGKGRWGIALGAALLVPVAVPVLARVLRPALKEAVKGYLALAERTREWAAEGAEQWQDLVAEAHAEYQARPSDTAPSAPTAASAAHGGDGPAAEPDGAASPEAPA